MSLLLMSLTVVSWTHLATMTLHTGQAMHIADSNTTVLALNGTDDGFANLPEIDTGLDGILGQIKVEDYLKIAVKNETNTTTWPPSSTARTINIGYDAGYGKIGYGKVGYGKIAGFPRAASINKFAIGKKTNLNYTSATPMTVLPNHDNFHGSNNQTQPLFNDIPLLSNSTTNPSLPTTMTELAISNDDNGSIINSSESPNKTEVEPTFSLAYLPNVMNLHVVPASQQNDPLFGLPATEVENAGHSILGIVVGTIFVVTGGGVVAFFVLDFVRKQAAVRQEYMLV